MSFQKQLSLPAINIEDVSEALDISAGTNTSPSQQQQVAADINGDEKLTLKTLLKF